MLKRIFLKLFANELAQLEHSYQNKLDTQAASFKQENALLKQKIESNQQKISDLEQQAGVVALLEQQLKDTQAEMARQRQNLSVVSDESQAIHAQAVADLDLQLQTKDQAISALRAENQAFEQRFQDLNRQLQNEQQQLAEARQQTEHLQSQYAILQSRIQLQNQAASISQPISPSVSLLPQTSTPQKKSVLIVDDAATTRVLQKNMLESAGFQVVMATDGTEGCKALETNAIDLIITDVEMPNMNGFEFTEWVKSSSYQDLPILMVTSFHDEAFREKGTKLGVSAFIEKKSFNPQSFLPIIQQYLV